jgi:hypothetical protein
LGGSTKTMGWTPIHRKIRLQTCRETLQLNRTWWMSSTSLTQKTQLLSKLLVILPFLNKTSFVGNFPRSNRQPKILTLDGTLFNLIIRFFKLFSYYYLIITVIDYNSSLILRCINKIVKTSVLTKNLIYW